MTPLLRFELLGRAIVGSVEYERDGGPSDGHNRLAEQVMAIGRMAVETAERQPEGWVVVDAFGRPWCRAGRGPSKFHPGAEIFVFDSEDECMRFAQWTNAQSEDNASKPVLPLSTRRFAKEATGHAESYRSVISGATDDLP